MSLNKNFAFKEILEINFCWLSILYRKLFFCCWLSIIIFFSISRTQHKASCYHYTLGSVPLKIILKNKTFGYSNFILLGNSFLTLSKSLSCSKYFLAQVPCGVGTWTTEIMFWSGIQHWCLLFSSNQYKNRPFLFINCTQTSRFSW